MNKYQEIIYKHFDWLNQNNFLSTSKGDLPGGKSTYERFAFVNGIKNRKMTLSVVIDELENKICLVISMKNLKGELYGQNKFILDIYLKLTYPNRTFVQCKHYVNQSEREKVFDEIVCEVASSLKNDFYELWNGNIWDERFYEDWR